MRLFRHELKSELLLYVRSRELAFFTFLFPIILFVLLGSSYGNDRIKSEGNVRGANFLEAGMIGYGAISIAFAGLAIVLVIRRESGVLKRLRATPLPAPAYIVALLTSFLAAFAVEVMDSRSKVPIVLLASSPHARSLAVEIGAVGVIGKPFDPHDLWRLVADAFAQLATAPAHRNGLRRKSY